MTGGTHTQCQHAIEIGLFIIPVSAVSGNEEYRHSARHMPSSRNDRQNRQNDAAAWVRHAACSSTRPAPFACSRQDKSPGRSCYPHHSAGSARRDSSPRRGRVNGFTRAADKPHHRDGGRLRREPERVISSRAGLPFSVTRTSSGSRLMFCLPVTFSARSCWRRLLMAAASSPSSCSANPVNLASSALCFVPPPPLPAARRSPHLSTSCLPALAGRRDRSGGGVQTFWAACCPA